MWQQAGGTGGAGGIRRGSPKLTSLSICGL